MQMYITQSQWLKLKLWISMDVELDVVQNCGCKCYDVKASGRQRGQLSV